MIVQNFPNVALRVNIIIINGGQYYLNMIASWKSNSSKPSIIGQHPNELS